MPEPDPKRAPSPQVPKVPPPKDATAAGAAPDLTNPAFLDLSQATPWARHVLEPQFTIRSGGNVGNGSVRAAEEIVTASTDGNLAAPQPAALAVFQDATNPRVLYGVPTTKRSASFLNLTWLKNNEVRANFRAILQLKEIVIPPGSRMVIDVEKINHPVHKHCVKLSWTENCFVPIQDQPTSAG